MSAAAAAYDWDPLRAQHDGPPPGRLFAEPLPETKGSKRSRQTYSKYQTAVLETVFQTSKYIVRSRRQQMSAELNLTERQIKIWFQNRRMKEKKCGVVHCKDSPPQPLADDRGGTAAMTAGYADDYCTELGRPAGYGPEDVFADFCVHGPEAARPRPPPQHHDPGYAGYGDCDGAGGGYDPPRARHEADPYAAAAAASKQHLHWGPPAPVAAVMDYDQDFFDDHDLDRFQRLPTAHHHLHHHHNHHHHRPLMNSQVPDYCPPQLQATHGY